jgi:uncharacterized protein YjcR
MMVELLNEITEIGLQLEALDGESGMIAVRKPKRRRPAADPDVVHGITTEEVAKRYRVSPDKVRAWVRRGDLAAINTSRNRCGKPRYVFTPAALAAFEQGHAAQTEAPTPKSRRLQQGTKSYFKD